MPGRVEEKVKLVCVKLKPNDTLDKVKSDRPISPNQTTAGEG